jgi:hypothetical protein
MSILEIISWVMLLICSGAVVVITVMVAIFMLSKED